MCLGLLTACEPTESKVPAPEVSRASQSSALTTLVVPLKWSGSGGSSTCTSICGSGEYACSNTTAWNSGQKPFVDPVPSGGVVVKVEARVYGNLTGGPSEAIIPVELNGVSLGTYTSFRKPCGEICDAPQLVSSGNSNGIPGYVYGGTNLLKLQVIGSGSSIYCVSHAELVLTVAEPRIQVSPLALNFGNQKPGTTSTAQKVTVTNVGDAVLRIDAASITGPFSVAAPAMPLSIPPGGVTDLAVSFSPTAVGSATGTLSLKSNDSTNPQVVVTLTGTGVAAAADVSPTAIDFGEQRVDTKSAPRTVLVRNAGSTTLTVSAVSINGPFAINSTDSFLVAPNETRALEVVFLPTVEGMATGTLTLHTDAPDRPTVVVNLTGKGVKPNLVVDPSMLAFGDVRVGTSRTQMVTMVNSGTGSITLTNITISGSAAFSLVTAPSLPFSLAPGAAQAFTVRYNPVTESTALDTGVLTFNTNDPGFPSLKVDLSGRGVKPNLVVDPSSLVFGDVRVGTSVTLQVKVRNTGSGPITVSSISKSGHAAFSLVSPPATPLTLAPGGTEQVLTVRYSPTAEAADTGVLTLATNDPDWLNVSVNLMGRGVKPTLVLSHTALVFGEQAVGTTSAPQMVTVRNDGTGTLRITALSVTPPFTVTPVSAFDLTPGTSKDLLVTFSPTAQGTFTGTLTLTSNDPAWSTATVSLSGTAATALAELSLPNRPGQTVLDFGEVWVNTSRVETVRLTNKGSAPLNLRRATLSANPPFAYIGPSTATLAPGAFIEFQVSFKPTASVISNDTLVIESDATNSPTQLNLTGKGAYPAAVKLSVTALDFGVRRVLETSGVQPLFITNTGGTELQITELLFTDAVFALSAPGPLPSPGAPLKIAPGQTRFVSVTFTPKARGVVSGNLYIVSNASEAPAPVSLTGTGVDGLASATPNTVAFGSVEVGNSGTQQVVALTNTGDYPLTITSVVQPVETSFSVSGLTPGLVLNPGEQRSFVVTFAPSRRGYVADTIVIKSDAQLNPTYNLSVSGTGIAPAVELLPKDIHFGRLNVGVTARQSIAIKNVGERDLYVSNLSLVDVAGAEGAALDFAFEAVLPLVVKPWESTLVSLTFTPRQVGLRQARVIVYTTDKAAEANLVGEGTSSNLEVSLSALDFGSVLVGTDSVSKVVQITNTGNGPLTLYTIRLLGADATAFTLGMPQLPLNLPPGATREVTVAFRPEAVRSFSAVLVLEANEVTTQRVTVPLSGSGVGQQIELSPSSVEFGQQLVGFCSSPRKVRVTNSSAFNATLTSLTVLGAGASQFSPEGVVLPLVLAPGQSQELGVAFTPQAEGEVSCTLKLGFAESSSQPEVGLRGRGIPKAFSVQPSPLDFGTVRAGGSNREQPLTFTNLSSETIVLAAPETRSSTGQAFLFDGAALAGRTIPPNGSIIVPVGYQPLVETLSETTLAFGTTTPAQPRAVDVQLKGRATLRLLSAAPGSLDFGRVDVGAMVEPKVVTVTNKSSQPQRAVVKLKAQGTPFTVDTTALADAIPAGGSATFKVAFQPQTEGEAQNEVEVWLQGETEVEALIPVKGVGRRLESLPGGCSCGSTEAGSAGMLALLALAGLGSRRRRRA